LTIEQTTHEKVRKRALGLIAMWTDEFESDTTLGIMEDCYNNLKAKSSSFSPLLQALSDVSTDYKFEQPSEPPPPTVDDEIRRKEEEELQRVLEMSMQDKGGRNQWSNYSAASSSGAGGSGSSSSVNRNNNAPAATSSASTSKSTPAAAPAASAAAFTQPKYNAGYVPARTPTPEAVPQEKQQPHQPHVHQPQQQPSQPSPQQRPAASSSTVSVISTTSAATSPTAVTMPTSGNIVTRVRALHTFEPTEPGELAFDKGDVIKVVDRGYKDWWRGQLKGRTGIFPVNYVVSISWHSTSCGIKS
jgi:signal transducing adaptor molecule